MSSVPLAVSHDEHRYRDDDRRNRTDIDQWKNFSTLLATKNHNLLAIDGDLINRPGPRAIEGAKAICAVLDEARQHRTQTNLKAQK